MFRLLIALPLLAIFVLPLSMWSAPIPSDQNHDSVFVKGGVEGDPSG